MIYLYVSYDQKDIAKSLGARWDPEKKLWYAPDNSFTKLLETFSPLESKPKEKPKITITKQPHYIKLIGENTSFREKELYIDLIPKNTSFSLYNNLSSDDYYYLKDTLVQRAGCKCEICEKECNKVGYNSFLCERFSYNEKTKVQKLEKINVLCSDCFKTTRLKDKTLALEYLQDLLDISRDEAKLIIYDAYELWKKYSTIQWNLDISLITNSGLKLKKFSEDEKVINTLDEVSEDTKKITIKKTNTTSSNFTNSNGNNIVNPSGKNIANPNGNNITNNIANSSTTKKITIQKKNNNEECLL